MQLIGVLLFLLILDSIPDGLAVDWEAKLIIYTDTGEDEIVRMDYNGHSKTTLFTTVDEPRGVALDFSKRLYPLAIQLNNFISVFIVINNIYDKEHAYVKNLNSYFTDDDKAILLSM